MRIAVIVAAAAVLLAARPADACSIFTNGPFETDPAHAGDTVPPSGVGISVRLYEVEDSGMCTYEAVLELDVSATDDATPGDRLGYRVRAPQGELGDGLPDRAFSTSPVLGSGELIFYLWAVPSAAAVELEVRAVDLNGNLGPASVVTVPVERIDRGCSAAGGGALGAALALLGLFGRRRTRR